MHIWPTAGRRAPQRRAWPKECWLWPRRKGLLQPGQTVSSVPAAAAGAGRGLRPQPPPADALHAGHRAAGALADADVVRRANRAFQLCLRPQGAWSSARGRPEQTGGYFLNYFDNDLNAEFHRRVTGLEHRQGNRRRAGRGCCGRRQRRHYYGRGRIHQGHGTPDVKVVAVEPYESRAIGGGYIGRHNIPGLGAGFAGKTITRTSWMP